MGGSKVDDLPIISGKAGILSIQNTFKTSSRFGFR